MASKALSVNPIPTVIISIGIVTFCLGWFDGNGIALLVGILLIAFGNYIFDK
jgi:hypothetical protein